jgi:predicted nucleotidyltransferase
MHKIPYDGPLTWLVPRTILYGVSGSRSYGTHRADSDHDAKGIVVPPRYYRDGFLHQFEQELITGAVDATIFDVRKFMRLAAECNPNICETLYVEPEDLLVCTEQGRMIVDHRGDFLSQRASHTFRHYAFDQLKRINTHRRWLMHPPTLPTREAFGLPKEAPVPKGQLVAAFAAIQRRMEGWEVDFGDLKEPSKLHIQEQVGLYLAELSIAKDVEFEAAARLLGYENNFIEMLKAERRYREAGADWEKHGVWKKERNEARAALEAKSGYDTKHGMHLVRLLRMCREILTEGVIHTRRPDAKELLDIRDGAWTYDTLIGWAKDQNADLIEIAEKSSLPKAPDEAKIDRLCIEIVQSMDDQG